MRPRSSTTASATQTYTVRRGRAASISTVLNPTLSPHRRTRPPLNLLTLPNEILHRIIITAAQIQTLPNKSTHKLSAVDIEDDEEATESSTPRLNYRTLHDISLSCRRLNDFASAIIYSAVSVHDARTARLSHAQSLRLLMKAVFRYRL